MNHYSNDPRQIKTKFKSNCAACGFTLPKGINAYYWPSSKKVYCLSCGEQDYNDFLAAAWDEDESKQLCW